MTDNPIAVPYGAVAAVWPETIPPLTFAEAKVAARKLFRLAGVKCPAQIKETRGNRHSWVKRYSIPTFHPNPTGTVMRDGRRGYFTWKAPSVLHINVAPTFSRLGGWRELVHDLSHWCFRVLEPWSKPHCEAHADLERRMASEVICRGWLEGRLKPEPQPVTVRDRPAERAAHAAKMLARAETRLKRAETIAKKWAARVRYYNKREQR